MRLTMSYLWRNFYMEENKQERGEGKHIGPAGTGIEKR